MTVVKLLYLRKSCFQLECLRNFINC